MNPLSIFAPGSIKNHFNIALPSTSRSYKWSLSIRLSHLNLCVFGSTCSAHLIILQFFNYECLAMSVYCENPYHLIFSTLLFLPVTSKYLSNTPFQIFPVYFSLSVSETANPSFDFKFFCRKILKLYQY